MHFTNCNNCDERGQQYVRILSTGEWTIVYIFPFENSLEVHCANVKKLKGH